MLKPEDLVDGSEFQIKGPEAEDEPDRVRLYELASGRVFLKVLSRTYPDSPSASKEVMCSELNQWNAIKLC